MKTLVLGSVPQIERTLKCYEFVATDLMQVRNFTSNLAELDALNKEIHEIIKLADHCKDVLKNLEG